MPLNRLVNLFVEVADALNRSVNLFIEVADAFEWVEQPGPLMGPHLCPSNPRRCSLMRETSKIASKVWPQC